VSEKMGTGSEPLRENTGQTACREVPVPIFSRARSDTPKIIVGLAVALVALTFPLWYALAAGRSEPSPAVELPSGVSQCVEPKDTMKAHHMELLRQWQLAVVREGSNEPYVSHAYGTKCKMSLTKTCLGCHTNRANFCDRCHSQVNVQPACWDCHNESKEK